MNVYSVVRSILLLVAFSVGSDALSAGDSATDVLDKVFAKLHAAKYIRKTEVSGKRYIVSTIEVSNTGDPVALRSESFVLGEDSLLDGEPDGIQLICDSVKTIILSRDALAVSFPVAISERPKLLSGVSYRSILSADGVLVSFNDFYESTPDSGSRPLGRIDVKFSFAGIGLLNEKRVDVEYLKYGYVVMGDRPIELTKNGFTIIYDKRDFDLLAAWVSHDEDSAELESIPIDVDYLSPDEDIDLCSLPSSVESMHYDTQEEASLALAKMMSENSKKKLEK